MLRSESIPLGHLPKRCKKSECRTLRRRPVADRFPRQRGCGSFSLGRRIKGWEEWEVTWCRKRRDGAGGSWERFDDCFSSFSPSSSSSYDESYIGNDKWNTNSNGRFSLNLSQLCLKSIVICWLSFTVIITSWAIVSLAGGGLAKVEEP